MSGISHLDLPLNFLYRRVSIWKEREETNDTKPPELYHFIYSIYGLAILRETRAIVAILRETRVILAIIACPTPGES